jgi:hypothetical protein
MVLHPYVTVRFSCKCTGKLPLYLIKHHAMKAYGWLFLISTLDGGEGSVLRPCRFNSEKEVPVPIQ